MKKLLLVTSLLVVPTLMSGPSGGLNPAEMVKPAGGSVDQLLGDLSGKRFSALKLVNTNTVKNLSLKWVSEPYDGMRPDRHTAGGARRGEAGAGRRTRWWRRGRGQRRSWSAALATADANNCNPARLGGGILVRRRHHLRVLAR